MVYFNDMVILLSNAGVIIARLRSKELVRSEDDLLRFKEDDLVVLRIYLESLIMVSLLKKSEIIS